MGIKGKYQNHVVAITGAASGMGRSMALLLAKNGCAGLALADYNADDLERTRQDIGDLCPVSTHVLDVRNVKELERYRDEAVEAHKRISVLINNAGIAGLGTFEETSKEQYDRVLDIDFHSVVNCSRIFFPLLKAEKDAHLVAMCSVYGYYSNEDNSAYHAAKFAVRGWTEATAAECSRYCPQIKVHCVHPGFTSTNIMKNAGYYAKMERENAISLFDKLGLHTPDQAAMIILDDVAANRLRILIGADAYMADYLVRLVPAYYIQHHTFRAIYVVYAAITSWIAAKMRDYLGLGDYGALVVLLAGQAYGIRRLSQTVMMRLFPGLSQRAVR
mmetsp:Transcript_17750/g.35009  ORF Transcript_17750/g.35009 Transcript_17750/m.35009 type:complete len:331 (+) Transcript_17750:90-1082(+)|eukprot:CAMPEP_0171573680 /NCGR_PEP_ID=MMETSP0961-20121227/4902_1 /TAXON_ID=87120 /ORGANISM="Aurantiochytrium limacinum, Strain ATCCMYA-1381" /LENGTH=330 /DNA_ID=CAMNT_0012128843 /DNA_START=45 /DNA_END=1037 /DNA_ORIENTATION=+